MEASYHTTADRLLKTVRTLPYPRSKAKAPACPPDASNQNHMLTGHDTTGHRTCQRGAGTRPSVSARGRATPPQLSPPHLTLPSPTQSTPTPPAFQPHSYTTPRLSAQQRVSFEHQNNAPFQPISYVTSRQPPGVHIPPPPPQSPPHHPSKYIRMTKKRVEHLILRNAGTTRPGQARDFPQKAVTYLYTTLVLV